MEAKESEIIDYLYRENEEYRKLKEEHKKLEETLAEMSKRRYLTVEEEMEKKRIKKEKLIKKDRMEEIIRKHREKHN